MAMVITVAFAALALTLTSCKKGGGFLSTLSSEEEEVVIAPAPTLGDLSKSLILFTDEGVEGIFQASSLEVQEGVLLDGAPSGSTSFRDKKWASAHLRGGQPWVLIKMTTGEVVKSGGITPEGVESLTRDYREAMGLPETPSATKVAEDTTTSSPKEGAKAINALKEGIAKMW